MEHTTPKGLQPKQAGQLTNWQKGEIRKRLQKQVTVNSMLERKIEGQEASEKKFPFTKPLMNEVYVLNALFELNEPMPHNATLKIFNTIGKALVRYELEEGQYFQKVNITSTTRYPSGMYYWTLPINGFSYTGRFYICAITDVKKLTR